jgi:Ca2+/Na+ antiporter
MQNSSRSWKRAARLERKAAGLGPRATTVQRPLPAYILLAAVIIIFLVLESLVPMRTAVQIGADEGFELAKATLCVHGQRLYTDVWNDQPPLHTFLVTQLLGHISGSVLGPRLLTVGFSAVLLISVFAVVRRVNGVLVATLTTAMIVASPGFVELSSSCMLEIPALATVMASLALLHSQRTDLTKRNEESEGDASKPGSRGIFNSVAVAGRNTQASRSASLWVPGSIVLNRVSAGILFGLGLQMKLVPIIYVPLLGFVMLLHEKDRRDWLKGLMIEMVLFGAGLAFAYVGSDLLIDQGAYLAHFGQSWKSHFGVVKASAKYGSPGEHPFEWSVLLKNWDVTLLATVGVGGLLAGIRKDCFTNTRKNAGNENRRTEAREGNQALRKEKTGWAEWQVLPLLWLALTFGVFGAHQPWWPYYYVHTAIPLCWCAAIAIGLLGNWAGGFLGRGKTTTFARGGKDWLRPAVVVVLSLFGLCSAGWMGARVYLQVANLRAAPKIQSTPVIAQLQRFRPYAQWLYADRLVYSFHSGIPVVPSLAVMPIKRLWSGELDNAGIRRELEHYKPGVLVLLNDGRDVPFKDLVDAKYQMVYMDSDNRMYALKEIARKERPNEEQ